MGVEPPTISYTLLRVDESTLDLCGTHAAARHHTQTLNMLCAGHLAKTVDIKVNREHLISINLLDLGGHRVSVGCKLGWVRCAQISCWGQPISIFSAGPSGGAFPEQ